MKSNKSLKKVIMSFVLIVGVISTSLSPIITLADSSSFKDVPINDTGYSAIMSLAEKGIVSGYGDGTFKPDANLSKVEALKIILGITSKVKLEEVSSQKSEYSSYSDVPKHQWYTSLVNFAKENGVITSNVQNTSSELGRDDKITRAEFITLFVNAFGVKLVSQTEALKGTKFADIKYNPNYHWVASAAYSMEKYLKYVNGYSETKFGPGNNITRREVAFIMNRYFSHPENFKNVELKTTVSKLLDSSVLTFLEKKGTKVSTITTTDDTAVKNDFTVDSENIGNNTDTTTDTITNDTTVVEDDFKIDFGNILDEGNTDTTTNTTTNTTNTEDSTTDITTTDTTTTVSDEISKLIKQETLTTTSLVQNSTSNIFELTLSAPSTDVEYDNFVIALSKQTLLNKDNFDRLYITDENDVLLTRDLPLVSENNKDQVTLRTLNSKGIEVKKGTIKKIKVKVVSKPTLITGSVSKFEFLTVNVNGTSKTVNYSTPNLNTAGVDVGQVVISLDPMTPSNSNLDVGVTDQILAVYKLTNNSINSSVKIKSIILDQTGTIDSTKVENVRGILGDKTFNATVLSTDKDKFKITFSTEDFTEDFKLNKGESKILIIKGNVTGGAGRTLQFKISNKYDIIAESGQYAGYFINPVTDNVAKTFSTVSSMTLGTFTINTGDLQITKSTSSANGEIPRGATEVDLASFDIQSTGESSKLQSITLNVGAGTAWPVGKPIQNVKILLDGQIVGSLSNMDIQATTEFKIDLNSDYEVKLNEVKKLTVVGDITSEVTIGSKIQLGIIRVEATGVESDNTIIFTSVSGELANTLVINNNTLLVNKDESVKPTYIVKGAKQKELGAIKIAVGNVEDLILTSIKLKTLTLADIQNLQNIKLYINDTQVGTTITTPSASINEITGIAKTIKKGQTLIITVKGDIKQSAISDQTISLIIPADGVTFVGVNSASTLQSPISDTISFDTFTIKSGGSIVSVSNVSAGNLGKDKIITPTDGSTLVWKGKITTDDIERITLDDIIFFDKKATDNRTAYKNFSLKITGAVDANGNTTTITKNLTGTLGEAKYVNGSSTLFTDNNYVQFTFNDKELVVNPDSSLSVELYATISEEISGTTNLGQFGILDIKAKGFDSGNYIEVGTDVSSSSVDLMRGDLTWNTANNKSTTVVLDTTNGIKSLPLITKGTLTFLPTEEINSIGTNKTLFKFRVTASPNNKNIDVNFKGVKFKDINSTLDGIAIKNVKLKDLTTETILVINNGSSFDFSNELGTGVIIDQNTSHDFAVIADVTGVSTTSTYSVKINKGSLTSSGDITWILNKNGQDLGTTQTFMEVFDKTGEVWDSDISSHQIMNFSSLDNNSLVPKSDLETLVISSATTVDSNNDGEIDKITVVFNQNIIDSKTIDLKITLSGVTGVTIDSISTGTSDDNIITLNVSGFPILNTSLTPTVNIAAGGIESVYVTNAALSAESVDGAKLVFDTTAGINNQANNGSVVTLVFTENIINNRPDLVTLKGDIKLATDGSTFNDLQVGDVVTALSTNTLQITFSSPLTGTTNKIKILPSALKDAANNLNDELISPFITIN